MNSTDELLTEINRDLRDNFRPSGWSQICHLGPITTKLRNALADLMRKEFRFLNEWYTSGAVFEHIHNYLPEKEKAADFETHISEFSTRFYELTPKLHAEYVEYVKCLATHLGLQAHYQVIPTIRFHFPGDFSSSVDVDANKSFFMHVDSMLGHPLYEINCWLALTNVYSSESMSILNASDSIKILNYFITDTKLTNTSYFNSRNKFVTWLKNNSEIADMLGAKSEILKLNEGETIVFDSRVLHGPNKNLTNRTRVSIDFRFLPEHDAAKSKRIYRGHGRARRAYIPGDVFSANPVGVGRNAK